MYRILSRIVLVTPLCCCKNNGKLNSESSSFRNSSVWACINITVL